MVTTKLRKGDVIGERYKVLKKLGEGGCGSVYRCKDQKGKSLEVAIKTLEDLNDMARFRREAKVMQNAKSQHVVQLHGRGIHDKALPFIVMEVMDGGSVRDLLDKKGKLSVEDAAWICVQTVRGLRSAGIVHRDLKPENLLIRKGGKGRGLTLVPGDVEQGLLVKVADFGLAKINGGDSINLTHSGQVMGTPVYMSPEQCRNTKRVSFKTDVYAVGIILYEMVLGKPPFDANNIYDIMAMQCNDEPKLGRLPSPVKDVVAKCLEKKPGKRYASWVALERDLAKVAGIRGIAADTGGLGTLIIVIGVLAGLGGAAWVFREAIMQWAHTFLGS